MPIGQLWYTWSARGLEGFNRFQIVASSEAVDGRMADFVAEARRLCSYPEVGNTGPGGDRAPVSFGWVDVGRTRYAFARTHLRSTEVDRRTSFAAHVVFGGFAEMDLTVLLGTGGTDLWWNGDLLAVPQDGQLPRLTADELAASALGGTTGEPGSKTTGPEPVAPEVVSAAVAACCFGGPVAVDSKQLAIAMRRVAGVLPELVDFGSFSSFEGTSALARSAEDFWAFGVGSSVVIPTHPALHEAPIAAALVTIGKWLTGSPWEAAALQAAWADTASLPDRYTGWLSLLHALSTPLVGAIDWARLLPVFAAPASFTALLSREDARSQLADQLVCGNDQLIHPFIQAAGALGAALHRSMAEALAAAALDRGSGSDASAVVAIGRGLPTRMREALLAAAGKRLYRAPEHVGHWPAELFIQLARRVPLRDIPASAAAAFLGGLAPVGGTVLADQQIEVDLRSALYHRFAGAGLRIPADALSQDPAFAVSLVRSAPGHEVIAELDVMPALTVLRLLSTDSGIAESRAVRLLVRTCERMAPIDRILGLETLRDTTYGRALVDRAEVLDPACAAFATAYLAEGRITPGFGRLAQLTVSGSPPWSALFRSLDSALARPARATRGQHQRAAPFVDYGVGPVAFELQLDAYACTVVDSVQVRLLADEYLAIRPKEEEWAAAERVLVAAVRCMRLGRSNAAMACVLYIAEDFAGDQARRTAPADALARIEPLGAHVWRQLRDGPAKEAVRSALTSRTMRRNRGARAWLSHLG